MSAAAQPPPLPHPNMFINTGNHQLDPLDQQFLLQQMPPVGCPPCTSNTAPFLPLSLPGNDGGSCGITALETHAETSFLSSSARVGNGVDQNVQNSLMLPTKPPSTGKRQTQPTRMRRKERLLNGGCGRGGARAGRLVTTDGSNRHVKVEDETVKQVDK